MAKKPFIKKQQVVAIQNAVTGELDTAKVTMIVARDVPKFKGEPFTLLFQASSRAISRNITPSAAKLLIYLCSIVDYNNTIPQGIPEMVLELGYSQRQLQRALDELVDMNVVLKSKHPYDKRINVYHLNPYQSWKGATKERGKKIEEYSKHQLALFPDDNSKLLKPNSKKSKLLKPNSKFDTETE